MRMEQKRMKYDDLIQYMKYQGIVFEKGLCDKEISEIEKRYEIVFPKIMKILYKKALPISEGFYNWRNIDAENIAKIKSVMEKPILGIVEGIEEIDWCEKWGEKPSNLEERKKNIKNMALEAPKLIPIYHHRYIASLECEKNPVFSFMGTDVIYYGKDLIDYFMLEFKLKDHEVFMNDEVSYIPFWSDLLKLY